MNTEPFDEPEEVTVRNNVSMPLGDEGMFRSQPRTLNIPDMSSRTQILTFILGCVVLAGCCCPKQSQVAIVPEQIFRTEISITNRIHLKLNSADRQRIENFLSAGGVQKKSSLVDHNSRGAEDLKAVPDAKDLLDLLSSRLLQIEELEGKKNETITRYFGNTFHHQVVDARNPDPWRYIDANGHDDFASPPTVFTHDRFWWIFYPDHSTNVSALMIVRNVTRDRPNE